jgi:hypothetical protein
MCDKEKRENFAINTHENAKKIKTREIPKVEFAKHNKFTTS